MSIFIETKRLIVKTPSLDDFDRLYDLQSDPEVMQFIGRGVRTKEEVHAGLEMAIQHQQKHGFSLGAVFEKDNHHYIGRAGLIYLAYDDTQPDIEIGYALLKPYWHKGYASELSRAFILWGFSNLPVQKLVGVINPANEKSRRVLENVGMHYVGQDMYHDTPVDRFEIERHLIEK